MADFSKPPVGTMMAINYGWTGKALRPIEKVMKKHIVCGGRKWKIDGWNSPANAGKWNRDSISVATPEDITAIQHAERVQLLRNTKWDNMKPDMVQIIYGMVKEANK